MNNNIYYISDFPVDYHSESLKHISIKTNRKIFEYYISDYYVDYVGKRYKLDDSNFLFKKYTFKPSFLKPFLINRAFRLFDKNSLIIFHGYNNINIVALMFFCYAIKHIRGYKLGFRAETTLYVTNTNGIKNLILNNFKRLLINLFDIIFYIGIENLNYYKNIKIDRNKKYIYWPYCLVDIPKNNPVNIPQNLDVVKLIYVGKYIKKKYILDFCKFLIIFADKHKINFRFELIGTGEDFEHLRKLNSPWIEFVVHGWSNFCFIKQAYINSHIFILPSTFEPYGMVVAEAAAHGLPMFISKYVGAASDYCIEGLNGQIFDPYCPDDTERKFLDLLSLIKTKGFNQVSNSSYKIAQENSLSNVIDSLK